MMEYKGCIMEIRENTMIVMTSDCQFQEIKRRNNIQEGMEIKFHANEIYHHKKRIWRSSYLLVATILFMIITSIYGLNYRSIVNQSVALVTVDINPSIQLEINTKNIVVGVSALNKDAEGLPLKILRKRGLDEALEILMYHFKEQGYIMERQENYILITTVSLQQDPLKLLELEKIIEESKVEIESKALDEGEEIEVITIQASKEALKKAEKQKISVGKFKIYEEIKSLGNEEMDLENLKNVKVKDLMEHPVFQQHPKNLKENNKNSKLKKEHPVFEEHLGKAKDTKDTAKTKKTSKPVKEHPVFDEHPGKGKDKKHPVFEEHPSKKKDSKTKNKK